MKKFLIPIGILCLVGSFVHFHVFAADGFSDTAGHKYADSIQFLSQVGVVEWYPNGTFWPDKTINRAEIMKIIVAASKGYDLGSGTNCFVDVQEEWFAPFVCYAKAFDIVKWYPDGTFKPGKEVTIAEALKMWLEAFGADVDESASDAQWYQPYFEFVHNNNIFSQYSMRADMTMTRGQMAYLVQQLMLEKQWLIEFDGKRDAGSLGCGKTAPSNPPTSSSVNGEIRNYITVIGKKYDKDIPMKLIFAFHGRTNPNTMVRGYYNVEEASRGDAIIIYPSGLPEEWPTRNWSNGWDKPDKLRDFALFDQLLAEFSSQYCINMDEIFVVWHSLGAWFTNSLACARGDVIRAIWSVGGGTTIWKCSGPTAAMIMQHPDDNLSSYAAGVTALNQLLAQNACGSETIALSDPIGGNCVLYTQCQEWAPVIWCPHSDSTNERGAYYPHTRPDFAGREIWDFFTKQE